MALVWQLNGRRPFYNAWHTVSNAPLPRRLFFQNLLLLLTQKWHARIRKASSRDSFPHSGRSNSWSVYGRVEVVGGEDQFDLSESQSSWKPCFTEYGQRGRSGNYRRRCNWSPPQEPRKCNRIKYCDHFDWWHFNFRIWKVLKLVSSLLILVRSKFFQKPFSPRRPKILSKESLEMNERKKFKMWKLRLLTALKGERKK